MTGGRSGQGLKCACWWWWHGMGVPAVVAWCWACVVVVVACRGRAWRGCGGCVWACMAGLGTHCPTGCCPLSTSLCVYGVV